MSKQMTDVATKAPARTPRSRPPNQWRAYLAITWAALLAQVRSVSNFVFGFFFPLAFIAVFGFVGNGATNVRLGVVDGSDQSSPVYGALAHISALQISHGSAAALEQKLKNGQLDGVLTIVPVSAPVMPSIPPAVTPSAAPAATTSGTGVAAMTATTSTTPVTTPTTVPPPGIPGNAGVTYNVTLETSSASLQTAAAAQAIVQGVADQVSLRLAGITSPPVRIISKDIAGRTFNFIDFELPGLLGFSLLSIAVFGTAFGFVVLKRTLVLKRIFATPTRPTMIVLGQGTSRLIVALAQVIVLLLAGIWLFHFHLANGIVTFAEMLVVSLFGLIAFLGFGLVIAGNFKDENAMGAVVNIITLPQFLLAGTFFPTDNFPAWLQPIANNLPLSYLNVALRDIASQGASLFDVRWQLLGVLAWGIGTYALAVLTFKWE